jgi:PilZ domain
VYPEKRRTPRYIFIASAELFEERSEVRVATRVSELSLHGCYLDMMNPFPVDTIVLLKIFAGEAAFKCKSKVIYSQPNMGSGMAFIDVDPDSLAILQNWLDEAAKDQGARAR